MIPEGGRICSDVLYGEHGENCRDRAEIELFAVVSSVFKWGKSELDFVNKLFFAIEMMLFGVDFQAPQSFCGIGFGLKRLIFYEI